MKSGIVAKEFYENFLAYINREVVEPSEIQTIAEEKTSEMIN